MLANKPIINFKYIITHWASWKALKLNSTLARLFCFLFIGWTIRWVSWIHSKGYTGLYRRFSTCRFFMQKHKCCFKLLYFREICPPIIWNWQRWWRNIFWLRCSFSFRIRWIHLACLFQRKKKKIMLFYRKHAED